MERNRFGPIFSKFLTVFLYVLLKMNKFLTSFSFPCEHSVTIIDSLCLVFSHRSVSLHGANWMERSDWVKYQNSGGAELARSLRSDPLQFHSIAPQIKERSLIVARLILRGPGSSIQYKIFSRFKGCRKFNILIKYN